MDGKGRRHTLREVIVPLAWTVVFVGLTWRWVSDREGPVLFPIVWTLYTLSSIGADALAIRDRRGDRRSHRQPDDSTKA